MRRPDKENAVRRWDAPAEQRNGGAVMECAGQKREDDEFDSMEHHLREKSSREMTSSRNCELRFNLNLRSKTGGARWG